MFDIILNISSILFFIIIIGGLYLISKFIIWVIFIMCMVDLNNYCGHIIALIALVFIIIILIFFRGEK